MFVHSIALAEKDKDNLKKLIAELEEIEVIGHGPGHNNSRVYMIYATKNLSEFLRNKGFNVTARQI